MLQLKELICQNVKVNTGVFNLISFRRSIWKSIGKIYNRRKLIYSSMMLKSFLVILHHLINCIIIFIVKMAINKTILQFITVFDLWYETYKTYLCNEQLSETSVVIKLFSSQISREIKIEMRKSSEPVKLLWNCCETKKWF